MKYHVFLTPTAHEDLAALPANLAASIERKIEAMEGGLPGSGGPAPDFLVVTMLDYVGERIRRQLTGARPGLSAVRPAAAAVPGAS